MQLYSVTNASSHPMQCVTVTDSRDKADAIAAKVKAAFPQIAGCVYVEKADSFFPSHMTDCDKSISDYLARA